MSEVGYRAWRPDIWEQSAVSESDPRRGPISNIPIPDPTLLTSAALEGVKRELKEYVDAAVATGRELFQAKLEARGALSTQRFESIQSAITMAFASATAATEKSEISTTKEIDGIKAVIGQLKDAQERRMQDLTDRINREQGSTTGAQRRDDNSHRDLMGTTTALVAGVSALALMVSIWVAFHPPPPVPALSLPSAVTITPH